MYRISRFIGVITLAIALSGCIHTGMSACTNSCTDNNITEAVQVKIFSDRCMSDQFILVSTYERVVTLKGRVSNHTQKRIATEMAKSVPGVKRVKNRLRIKPLDY